MEMRPHHEPTNMAPQRDENSGQYVKSYSLDVFVDALDSTDGMASTGEVADVVGCSDRLALNRLHELVDEGRVRRRTVGNSTLWIVDDEADT